MEPRPGSESDGFIVAIMYGYIGVRKINTVIFCFKIIYLNDPHVFNTLDGYGISAINLRIYPPDGMKPQSTMFFDKRNGATDTELPIQKHHGVF
jgi:hypothetical protein